MRNMDKKVSDKLDHIFSGFPDTDASEHSMKEFHRRYAKRRNFVTFFSRAAAILIVPLLGLLTFQHFSSRSPQTQPLPTLADASAHAHSIIEYTVVPGVRGRVVLPDSSEVWLNSGSSLRVPAVFGDASRVVELEGEAFFDVRNDQRPLYVRTNRNITVRVAGTRFNLSTYANDEHFRLHLLCGKVKLINENNNTTFKMLSNQKVSIADAEQAFNIVENPNERANTAWKMGYLVFCATPLSEVIRRLERWYGVNVVVNSPRILQERFTAEFQSESLTQVLDFLKITSGICYRILNGKVILGD